MKTKAWGSVQVGEFIRVQGHRIGPSYAKRWHKIIDTSDPNKIAFVDRHGTVRHWRYMPGENIRFRVWQPGDPRHDDA